MTYRIHLWPACLVVGLLSGLRADEPAATPKPATPAPLLTQAELAAKIDQMSISELRRQLDENSRLDRDGQQLIRLQTQYLSVLSLAQQEIAVALSYEGVVRCHQLLSKPENLGKLTAEMKQAATEDERKNLFLKFLTDNQIDPQDLEMAASLKKSQKAVAICETKVQELTEQLRNYKTSSPGDSVVRGRTIMSEGGTAVERLNALENKWQPGPATTEAPSEPEAGKTGDIMKFLEAFTQ